MSRTEVWPERAGLELIETTRTRDRALDLADGSWITVRSRPPGEGWRIAADGERWTKWTRRRRVQHRARRGRRWLP